MRMHALAISLAAGLWLSAAPAWAQNLEPLNEALDKLPDIVLQNPRADQAAFVDMEALRRLSALDGAISPQTLQRAVLGVAIEPVQALTLGPAQEWNEKAGIDLAEVRYFIGFGSAPQSATVWGLRDNAAADGMLGALQKRGFTASGAGVLGNGEPGRINPSRHDPSDPWLGTGGAARFAGAKGNVVLQSSAPQAVTMLQRDARGADEHPIVRTALAGLEAAVGDHTIVQALVVSPVLGLRAGDPAQWVGQPGEPLAALQSRLQGGVPQDSEGLPPWLGGIIVDAQADQPAAAISLTYADCDAARKAATLMKQRWADTMPENAQGDMVAEAVPGSQDGLCAATLRVSAQTQEAPLFRSVIAAMMRRQFTVLQIGAGG